MTENGVIEFNKDELVPPIFLDHKYFENVLKTSENDKNLKLLDHKIIPGSKPGDHYASIMFKIIVTYQSRGKTVENRSIILKTVPQEEGTKKDFLNDMPMFVNETKIYTKILPEMERILRNCGDYEPMGPKIVYQTAQPPVIILDDITKQGYEMKYEQLDFEELQMVIDKIAKYHALSFLIADEKSIDTTFRNAFENPNSKEMFMRIIRGVSYLTTQIKTWPGFEKVYEKMIGADQKILMKMFDLFQPDKSWGYSILNHGDFHLKNLMFKKNGTKFDDVMLLDFQLPFWGSAGIDLAYLIYAIGNEDTHRRRYEVYSIYHSKFCGYLEKFGYMKKPPSLLDLNIEVLKSGAEELFIVLCLLRLSYVDFTKVDMTELFDSSESGGLSPKVLYSNPQLIARYKVLLPEFMHKGYLD